MLFRSLKPNGQSVEYGDNWENTTYTISNNTIETRKNAKYGVVENQYNYNSSADKVYHEFGARYDRIKSNGPDCVSFLFDGNKTNDNKEKTKVEFSGSTNSATDWDKILDNYETMVNKYIAVAKKVNSGDVSVISDMASILEDAEKLEKQLENASDKLTTKQASRFNNIVSKLATAASEI